ncbi:MlaE family ABC transporter permease [Polyangium aurulentum]|uniref:MlaE family ABC transporter permease n=1 Tax=Polyangium aurulentum TaxID=2567896 RepID=UPI0010ADAAD8|nr:ABC transporter permease [Polyangium aurulentum]UQA60271.1 ABC transporter permease [Polyangium aurulentum]
MPTTSPELAAPRAPLRSQPNLPAPPPEMFWERFLRRSGNFFVHLGQIGRMTGQAFRAMFRRPFEFQSTMYQMEQLGVRSLGIACATAIFTGMVMAVQFAFGLQKFGGMEYTGRVIGLSFSRELAPTLTAVIVGGRIGSGIAAEVGSMAVTEQIDAIRALGADPVKKLVVPRLLASVIVMPVLGSLALVLGFSGAMLICDWQFGIPWGFFLRSALGSLQFRDFIMGIFKCPFFGALIAIVGCHFGLITRGGTEGVGQSTTHAVVGVSISILVADFVLTKLGIILFG